MQFSVTDHANSRLQQRGVSHEDLELIMWHGQRKHVKGGCVKRFITHRKGNHLVQEGLIPARMMPHICGINVVIDESTMAVITVERVLLRRREKRSHGFKS